MANKKPAESEPEAEATEETAAEADAPEPQTMYDLVGEDGRRILRAQPYQALADERGRIQATSDEKLEIVEASPLNAGMASPLESKTADS